MRHLTLVEEASAVDLQQALALRVTQLECADGHLEELALRVFAQWRSALP